jgi:aromatic-L-amino-acid decarboxylase
MTENFRRDLDLVADWVAKYEAEVEQYPVLSRSAPGDLLEKLPSEAPLRGESFEDIFADFNKLILPGITHWQHPRFMGYFPANSSPPSVLAEMLIASMGVQGMSWATSPAATELEIRMMEWLRDLFGLDAGFHGVIQDSASASTMTAMLVARERTTNYQINESGYGASRLIAYCSEEAHSSVEKAAKIIGLGRKNLRKIPVDENQSMRIDLLAKAVATDRASGLEPFFVVGAFGTTGSTAVDDLDRIATIAAENKLWFHVDAAYAGAALVLPEYRELANGINRADSVVINPHKWLLVTFDCSAFYIRDKCALLKSLSILPEYLKTPEAETVTNYRDWSLGLGRRFRSLKLWFVMRYYGQEGIRGIISTHIKLAQELESWIGKDDHFELMSKRHFNLVCFRFKPAGIDSSDELNAVNMKLLEQINASGKLFLSHTKLDGKVVLRAVVGQTGVNAHHVREAWNEISKQARSF